MRKRLAAVLALAIPALVVADYPRKELLVEVGDVARLVEAGNVALLDVRPKKAYDEAHLPKATWIDADAWAKEFKDGDDVAGWSKRLGEAGLKPALTVLVYDDDQHRAAARVWWMLRYWGFPDVRVVHGGWKAYVASGRPASKEPHKRAAVEGLDLKREAARLASKEQLKEALKAGTWQIVDARSEAEFCGTKEMAKRNGAVPGALHLEWSDAVDKATGKLKPPAELAALFKQAGIDPKKPTATYCQGGGRAAMMAFTLELMGGDPARNYYKSWGEWGNADDTPVVKPEKK